MDPWLNLAFPLKSNNNIDKYIYRVFNNFGVLVNYFEIIFDKTNCTCITHEIVEYAKSKIDHISNNDIAKCMLYLQTNNQELLLPTQNETKKRKHTSDKTEQKIEPNTSRPVKRQKKPEAPDPELIDPNALDTFKSEKKHDDINSDVTMPRHTDEECNSFFDLLETHFDDAAVETLPSLQQSFVLFQPLPETQPCAQSDANHVVSNFCQSESVFNQFDISDADNESHNAI